jgi:lariat debranching enzyme
LHVRFTATVRHDSGIGHSEPKNPDEIALDIDDVQPESISNPDKIQLDMGDESVPETNPDEIQLDLGNDTVKSKNNGHAAVDNPTSSREAIPERPSETHFLALDKCLPRRQYIELVSIEVDTSCKRKRDELYQANANLEYDPNWLAITRVMHRYFDTSTPSSRLPLVSELAAIKEEVKAEMAWIQENVVDRDLLAISTNFAPQAPSITSLDPSVDRRRWARQQPPKYSNPQTQAFCDMLRIENRT